MYKVKNSHFDQATKSSRVTITTELGDFHGYADLHPEDCDYESSFTGCHIAEMRARCKYWKALRKQYKTERKALVEMATAVGSLRTAAEHYKVINMFEKRIGELDKKIEELTEYICHTPEVCVAIDKNHRDVVDKLNKNKDKNV